MDNTSKINLDLPKIENGESVTLTNINGDYILSEAQQKSNEYQLGIEQATYDFKRSDNILSKYLDTEQTTFVTTQQELRDLSKNTQNDVDKVIKINSITKYYINQDDLIGKVVETIENNVNTAFKLNYKSIPADDPELREKVELVIDKFHKDIDIEKLILENAASTYSEGNFITYLRGDAKKGYSIDVYPLNVCEVSPYKIGSEPVLTMDINELKSIIQKAQSTYKGLKSNKLIKIYDKVEEEIKALYPEEVYKAVTSKDKIAFLDPSRTGISRINNLRGLYGVTPVFKALPSMLMVETIDECDKRNLTSRSKKIYHQVLRKELLGQDGTKTKHVNEIAYAHTQFVTALSKQTCIVTTPAYVEEIKILEAKTEATKPETVLSFRNRVLNALGISFLSNESKSSFNSVNVSVDELLKTVNKISRQLEYTLNKYYKVVLDDYGIDEMYSPTVTIEDTRMLDTETKLKLVDTLYSKLGLSYRTVIEMLNLNFETEVQNRMAEQEFEYNGKTINIDTECFVPHSNSYTANSNDIMSGGEKEAEPPSKKDDTNVDENVKNQERYKNQL